MFLLSVLILATQISALIHGSNSTNNGTSVASTHSFSSSESERSTASHSDGIGSPSDSASSSSSAKFGSYIQQGIQAWSTPSGSATSQASGTATPPSDAINATSPEPPADTTTQNLGATKPPNEIVSSAITSETANGLKNQSISAGFSSTPLSNGEPSVALTSSSDPDVTLNKSSVGASSTVPSSTTLLNKTLTAAPNSVITRPASLSASSNATNGTGFQAALKCWSQWNEYSDSQSSTMCYSTGLTTYIDTISFPDTLYDAYTLCDGVPRAVITNSTHEYSSQTVTFSQSGWFQYTATISSEVSLTGLATRTVGSAVLSTSIYSADFGYSCGTLSAPITTPSCSIAPQYCSSAWNIYSSLTAKQVGNSSSYVNTPPCTYISSATGDPCDGSCAIYVNTVQLIYFPVTMAGNFCGDYHTVAPNVTTPITAVAYGTTFTSGTAYVYYSGASAGGAAGTCGSVHSSGILAVPSSSISSYRFFAPGPTVTNEAEYAPLYSFNFADLPPNPVPAEAWSRQASCINNLGESAVDCRTITEANYAPLINALQFFTSLDPKWAKCQYSGGVVDPPYALSEAGFAAAPAPSPTAPVSDSQSNPTAPATPGSGPPPAYPAQTASPSQPKGSPEPTQGDPQASDPPAQPASPAPSNDPSASNDPSPSGAAPSQNSASPSPPEASSNLVSEIIGGLGGGSPSSPPNTPAEPAPASDPASRIIAGLTQTADSSPSPSEASPVASAPSVAQNPSPGQDPPPSANPALPIATVGGLPVAKGSSGGVVIGGTSLDPGSSTVVDNTPVAISSGTVVIGGGAASTIPIPNTAGSAITQVGGKPVSVDPDGGIIISGSTLQPGSETTIDNTPVSVGTQGIVVAGSTVAAPPAASPQVSATIASVGGQPVIAGTSGEIIVGGQTIHSGEAATVDGTQVSAGGQGIVVSNVPQTIPLPGADPAGSVVSVVSDPAATSPGGKGVVLTIGSQTVTGVEESGPNGTPVVVAGSLTLTEGGPAATVSGTVFSADPDGVAVGGQTVVFSSNPGGDPAVGPTSAAVLTLGSSTVTAVEQTLPNGQQVIVLGSSTLSVGGSAQTINGETISAGSSGVVVVSNDHTSTIPFSKTQAAPLATEAILTLGASLVTAIEEPAASGHPGVVVIDGHTLTVGGARLTTEGETISAASTGLIVISDGRTSTIPFTTTTSAQDAPLATEAVLTLGSSLITATEAAAASGRPAVVVIDGHTLTVGGPPITLDGETISAGSTGLVIVSGSRTITDPYSTVAVRTGAVGGGSTAGPGGGGSGGGSVAAGTTTATAGGVKSMIDGLGFVGHFALVVIFGIAVMTL